MGLGLGDFLNHGGDGKRKFLGNWKKNGSIVVWLHTRAAVAYPRWSHAFVEYGTWKNRETGEELPTLRYPRFVSPDPEAIHQSQYFREPDDKLRLPPINDPFLKLREWLRQDCQLPYDTVVFRWEHPNPKPGSNPIIEWRRGNLARLVDKTQATYSHTLDTKLEYFFIVVDDANPAEGSQIVQGPKLLGDEMKREIREQLESNGADAGNPLIQPYAFKWVFDPNSPSPMTSYRAFRYNQSVLTPPIREAITSSEFPDPTSNTKIRPGDKIKIRAAMEAAAQIDLPWDLLFPDTWVDVEQESVAPVVRSSVPEVSSQPAAQDQPTGQPQRRRKKKVEMIPCDDCGNPMPITATKCASCGAQYEIDEEPDPKPSTASQPNVAPQTAQPVQAQQSLPQTQPAASAEKCWSCGGEVKGSTCSNCGLDVSDELPF